MTLPVVSEDAEQANFVQWLQIKGYKYTSIPNSTFTKSWMQKQKNTRLGLRAGFPDLIIIASGVFMCVEMKRSVGGQVTPAQASWHTALALAGIPVAVCKGCEEAIAFVQATIATRPGENK